MRQLFALALMVLSCDGHGVLVWPPSNRVGGTLDQAGACENFECMWFSHPCEIPGEPTLDPKFRTFNLGINDGPMDWTRTAPWRAPGTAPVRGSGCGVAGGNPVRLFNGGFAPVGIEQGADGLTIPAGAPHVWKRGAIEEVAFGLTVNHGGGYNYRLCKVSGTGVNEECFQKNPLRFSGDKQWFQFGQFSPTRPRYEVPLFKTNNGTFPVGSEWIRIPVPACKICDPGAACGAEMSPNFTDFAGNLPSGQPYYGGQKWIDQIECSSLCTGATPVPEHAPPPVNDNKTDYGLSDGLLCPPGMTQYAEVLPGISGFLANHSFPERSIVGFSIVDKVIVPDLEDGTYILSWRWDCESTTQVWQNCADIQILGSAPSAPSPPPPNTLPPVAPPADSWKLYFIIAVSALGLVSAVSAIAFFKSRSIRKSTPLLREPLVRSSIQKA